MCSVSPGVCVAEPVQVSVNLPLSVDVPLPYQVIRGEQVELKGSVYNQQDNAVMVTTPVHHMSHDLYLVLCPATYLLTPPFPLLPVSPPPPPPPQFCVTLTAGPAVCLQQSHPNPAGLGLHSTSCSWTPLSAGGVGKVSFTLLGLEPGDHILTFTLRTRQGGRDVLEKRLRVVVGKELLSS